MRQCSRDLKEISVNVKNGFLDLQLSINAMHCLREMKAEELGLKHIQAVCSVCICFLAVVLLWLLILNIAVIAFSFAALPN